ncbi:MAG: STAS domain-containing protein, partial [Calditrichia bacterium]
MSKEGISIQSKIIDKSNNIAVIELGGYIDQANVHLLQKEIDHKINEGLFKIIFNMQNLVYMSSAGWGVLIGEIKRFRENGGDIKLCSLNPEVYEIFQMLEFFHIINEYASIEDALD